MREAINIIGLGVTDPHIHVFADRAYLYASHDYAATNTRFDMRDWQVWSSDDLLNWRLESTLKPEDIYIGGAIDGCWATDAVEKDGTYYWAFSDMNRSGAGPQIGMVVSDSPGGPWTDALGGPLLPHDCASTPAYDPCFFKEDDGCVYILFGVWEYCIAKMSDYAMSESLYGPYAYRGCVVDPDKMEKRFRENTWPHGPTQGRHGNYFEWKGQWYFTYCEMAFSGNRFFRDFWISRVEYADDGRILPIGVDSKCIR